MRVDSWIDVHAVALTRARWETFRFSGGPWKRWSRKSEKQSPNESIGSSNRGNYQTCLTSFSYWWRTHKWNASGEHHSQLVICCKLPKKNSGEVTLGVRWGPMGPADRTSNQSTSVGGFIEKQCPLLLAKQFILSFTNWSLFIVCFQYRPEEVIICVYLCKTLCRRD